MAFKKTLIIGLGLIGGSFAKALRKANLSEEIFASDLDDEMLDVAKALNIIEDGYDDLTFFDEEFLEFDLVVIATPLSEYAEIFETLAGKLSPSCIIIDLGSIKNLRIKNLPKNFVPCHPIAGLEISGFENSDPDLFVGKKFIICPENRDKNSVDAIADLAKKIGAVPELLEAKKHDEIFALVSHLPQFLSFLTRDLAPKNIKDDFFKKAFRLDNSNPEIWSDIFAMNETNLEKFYMKFYENLEELIQNPEENVKVTTQEFKQRFGENFLEENFAAIFFRTLIVKAYLEIPEIKTFKSYGGSGFQDFTSIISLLDYNYATLVFLAKKNQQDIKKLFDQIS